MAREDYNIQREIIKAAHSTQNQLIDISKKRKAKELDFLTDLSLQYRDKITSPHASNENVDPKLTEQVIGELTKEADNSIIYYETQLKHGEMLYMPEGYWHYMKYLTPGFSMSLRSLPRSPKRFVKALYNYFIMRHFDNAMRKIQGERWLNKKLNKAVVSTHQKNNITESNL